MHTTIPRPATEPHAARDRQCPLCEAAPGIPCQAKPPADHLARYLDAFTAGKLTRAYMAMVLGELVVIAAHVLIQDGGKPGGQQAERITICCYCRKRVYRQKDGTWYHRGNGSTSCRPGEGSDRRATPLEIQVRDGAR